mmetsp:Transcript_18633/g.52034  ORF Transcript_18633/g.52034 Transcript_18633/m.52034 type:complete len:389 (-) Transcript_18633:206-1372(-)
MSPVPMCEEESVVRVLCPANDLTNPNPTLADEVRRGCSSACFRRLHCTHRGTSLLGSCCCLDATAEDPKFRRPPRLVAKFPGCSLGATEAQPDEAVSSQISTDTIAQESTLDGTIRQPQVATILAAAWESWQVDTLELADLTGDRPLSTLAVYLFDRHGLCERFGLDRCRLVRYMEAVEQGYDPRNSYHNRSHAASVLHATHALLSLGCISRAVAVGGAVDEKLAIMAALLAAAVHDYDHPGVNNDFLVRTSHPRAVRYNDRHVNEHHSVAAAFELLRTPEFDFLESLPIAEYRRMRSLVVDMVLGTDVAEGSRILKALAEATGADDTQATSPGSGGIPQTRTLRQRRRRRSRETAAPGGSGGVFVATSRSRRRADGVGADHEVEGRS